MLVNGQVRDVEIFDRIDLRARFLKANELASIVSKIRIFGRKDETEDFVVITKVKVNETSHNFQH